MAEINPIRPTDDEARSLARQLITNARFGALAVLDRDTGAPYVSRIAIVPGPNGTPLTLVSQLSAHTRHLLSDPRCSLLLGEPGPTGDPLTHPRMSLDCRVEFIGINAEERPALREHYLAHYPKAKLYIDFADFLFGRFLVASASLNGGFGKAFQLSAEDLKL